MTRFLLLILALLLCICLPGCLTTERATSGVTGTTPHEGGELQAQRSWQSRDEDKALAAAEHRKRLSAIEIDTKSDIAAMEALGMAREAAYQEADAELRSRRLGTAVNELGNNVRVVSDAERLYWEAKLRREQMETRSGN